MANHDDESEEVRMEAGPDPAEGRSLAVDAAGYPGYLIAGSYVPTSLAHLPAGITQQEYVWHDLETGSAYEFRVTETVRDRVIDVWLTCERLLRNTCAILMSPTENLRPRVWALLRRTSGADLVKLTRDLLVETGHPIPQDFLEPLVEMANLRNLLAHQASRPHFNKKVAQSGITLLQVKGFNQAAYVTVTFDQLESAVLRVDPIMRWLVQELPEADHSVVSLDDEVVDSWKEDAPAE